uniref:EGF-like domain-containing protein n=1 Tax=Magallana gigas TaxID=29159 RepID=A0A8W8ICE5_MAGGI
MSLLMLNFASIYCCIILELGKDYFLNIPIIDNDGDQFHCELSTYLEANAFDILLKELKKENVLSIDKDTCILTLRVKHSVFRIGDSFGIPVTVKDYVTTDTVVGTSTHFAYNTLVGRVTVLMYYNVTGDTYPPEFVTPTPPNNQKYTIYVGGDFHVNVYAKPTLNSRNITKFNFLRRDGKTVNQTRHVASWDQKVTYISMIWSPVDNDKGHHIVCANAEDSAGHIVGEIVSTSESEENVTIEYSHTVINGSLPTTVAQVEFLATLPGPRQICLNASDSIEWTTRCLYVTVQKPDPCASLPCQHGGLCSPSTDNSEFQCHCVEPYTGQFCENGNKVCARNESPCFNTTCMDIPVPPHFMCGDCPYDKVGYTCDIENHLFTNDQDQPYFAPPTPGIGSVITCDFEQTICNFPIYVSSSSLPYVGSFNHTDSSSRIITFSTPLKDVSSDIYQITVSVESKTRKSVPEFIEYDVCLDVAKTISPHVELGHFDKTFELKSLVLEPSANQGGIVHGTLTVIGYDLGMKLICVDSFDSPQKTKIEDELCYKIHVTKGQYFAPKTLFPYFLHPTPPDSTTMQCVVNEQCYINIWAKNKLGVDHCPLLQTDKNIEDGVHVFPLNDTVKALALECPASTTDSVMEAPLFPDACVDQDFRAKIVPKLTPLFGDFVLPKFIRCPLREECVIPYSVTKTDSSCGFHLSWSGENFSSVHFTSSVILESLDCCGRATIIHNVSGIDEFCLSLKSSDGLISYDNVCSNVSSERDTADVNLYMFQSQFIHPSPTNGSEFSCTPGQPCHVMFSTGKHLNQKCPDVRDITTSPVHIFASLNTECHHDILILSEKNDTGSKKYCFQTMVSGITGETRCITVHFMFHVLPLNTTTTVTDISSTSTSFVSQSSLNVLSTTDVPITANSVNAQDSNTEVKQKVAKGRVECYCINPDNGIITKVIALNPRVSTEKLLIAAGLGSGAMVTTLGVAALLFTLTKGFRSSNKTGRTQNSRKSRKISVQSLKDEEN